MSGAAMQTRAWIAIGQEQSDVSAGSALCWQRQRRRDKSTGAGHVTGSRAAKREESTQSRECTDAQKPVSANDAGCIQCWPVAGKGC